MSNLAPPFRLTVEPRRSTIVLATHGEIDMASAPVLTKRVRELLDAGFTRLVLDLRDASFLDSSGLGAILDARAAAQQRHVGLALIAGPPEVQRVLAITGLDTILEFADPNTLG